MRNLMRRMITGGMALSLGCALAAASLAGCEQKAPAPSATPAPKAAAPAPAIPAPVAPRAEAPKTEAPKAGAPSTSTTRKFRFGVIAKSQSNPVFIAAKNGAMAAGRELAKERGVEIEVIWNTPPSEDAQKQAEFITQLANSGVDGIAVSVTDANVLTSAINAAVDKGVPVVCFDSDAPNSKRMAIYGMDDADAGQELARQLVKAMGDKGVVAVLAGNPNAANLQARVRGVREELAKHKGITIKDVYPHTETANDAVAKIKSVQTANPDITGWAFVGGWPLYTDKALEGVADKGVTVVSIDTLQLPLAYLKRGEVKALVGQDYYGWGYESIRMLLDYATDGKKPANPVVRAKVDIVTPDKAEEFGKVWEKWLTEVK